MGGIVYLSLFIRPVYRRTEHPTQGTFHGRQGLFQSKNSLHLIGLCGIIDIKAPVTFNEDNEKEPAMEPTTRDMIGMQVVAADSVVGKIDDLYFDVRTGHITHASVALKGWQTGTIVLVPFDVCGVIYQDDSIVFLNKTETDFGKAPLLDDETALIEEVNQIGMKFMETAPCWSFRGRCCVTSTRSESVEKATGQTAIWGSRDLMKVPVFSNTTEELGRVKDLVLDTSTWRITHITVRKGHWPNHEDFNAPMEEIFEVEGSGKAERLVLIHPVPNCVS